MNMLAYYAVGAHPVILVLVVLILVGLFPGWGWGANYGWGYPGYGIIIVILILLLLLGCSTFETAVTNPEARQLANSVITAVTKQYAGEDAAALASAGLSAVGEVMQGYVDHQPPLKVAAQSAGVKGVGQTIVTWLQSKGYMSQQTVNTIHDAATIAANTTEQKK